MTLFTNLLDRLSLGSLGRRSLVSGLWSLTELGLGNMLRLVSNLILTRLLVPEAFGLMAMVTTIQVGVSMVSDLGIRQSIIRAADIENPVFLRTAWTVQVLRGGVIAALVAAAGVGLWNFAPALAVPGTVYADPVLPFLMIASALTIVIESFGSINAFLAHRRMEMGRLTALSLSAQIFALLVMVGLASLHPTVWALLLGGMAGATFRMVLSHLVFDGPGMRPAWDQATRAELWNFGKWIIGSSALSFLARNADRLILGALIPATTFALYVIASLWVQAYATAAAKLGAQAGLPLLSEIRRNRADDMPRLFRKYARMMDLFCFAGFLLFLVAGDWLIARLYTADYRLAGSFIPLLALTILTQRFVIFSQILVVEGDSFQLMFSNAAAALAVCIAIPLGFATMDIVGAIAASILAPQVGVALRLRRAQRLLGPSMREDWVWFMAIITLAGPVIAVAALPV